MIKLVELFAGNGLKFAAIAGIMATLFTWDFRRIKAAEKRGGETVRVETRKANDAAVKTSERVRAKSQSSSVRNGVRDPNTVN